MNLNRQSLAVLALTLLIAVPASAARFRVRCDQGQTISKVLKRARPGDTISVAGTCQEAVTVTIDDLTLDGRGSAVLDGMGQEALLVEGARRVRIQNITVRNGELGLFVRGAGSTSLSDVTIADNARGLQVSGGSSARLADNVVIHDSGDFGLVVDSSATVIFEDDASVESRDNGGAGVLVGASANLLVDGGSTLSSHDNGGDGVLMIGGATVSIDVGSTLIAQHNSGNGLNMLANSFLSTDPQAGAVTLTENDGLGLALDDGSSALLFGATAVDNGGAADVFLSRLARGTFFGNTIGNLACDGTALLTGDVACP